MCRRQYSKEAIERNRLILAHFELRRVVKFTCILSHCRSVFTGFGRGSQFCSVFSIRSEPVTNRGAASKLLRSIRDNRMKIREVPASPRKEKYANLYSASERCQCVLTHGRRAVKTPRRQTSRNGKIKNVIWSDSTRRKRFRIPL